MHVYLLRNLSVLLAATAAVTCAWSGHSVTLAEEVFYSFEFDDGVIPDDLEVVKYGFYDDLTETLACEVSSGQMRIFDTVPASCGAFLTPNKMLTETHISVELDSPRGFCELGARITGPDRRVDGYACYLYSATWLNGLRLEMHKFIDGEAVYTTYSNIVGPGPYLLEFDVEDIETATGYDYTAFTARLTFNNGHDGRELRGRDFGTLGGYDRLTSGSVSFGAGIGPDERDAGWLLDATFDNVVIRGTLVPEPGALTLLLSASGISLFRTRRRRA